MCVCVLPAGAGVRLLVIGSMERSDVGAHHLNGFVHLKSAAGPTLLYSPGAKHLLCGEGGLSA